MNNSTWIVKKQQPMQLGLIIRKQTKTASFMYPQSFKTSVNMGVLWNNRVQIHVLYVQKADFVRESQNTYRIFLMISRLWTGAIVIIDKIHRRAWYGIQLNIFVWIIVVSMPWVLNRRNYLSVISQTQMKLLPFVQSILYDDQPHCLDEVERLR